MIRKALIAAALATISIPSHAAVTVLGNSQARECYVAALLERATPSSIRICNDALENAPLYRRDRVATHVNRGILYAQSGDFTAALADYDRALELDEEEAEAYLNKGLAILRRDGTSSASALLPLFNAAIEYGTREPAVAHYGRAIIHEHNGDIPEAYHDLRRAQELDPQWDAPTRELERFVVQQ